MGSRRFGWLCWNEPQAQEAVCVPIPVSLGRDREPGTPGALGALKDPHTWPYFPVPTVVTLLMSDTEQVIPVPMRNTTVIWE